MNPFNKKFNNLFKKKVFTTVYVVVKTESSTDNTVLISFVNDKTKFRWIKLNDKNLDLVKMTYRYNMYAHLYGKKVSMDDRFETEHIWSEEKAHENFGRWEPQEIKNQIN